MGGEACSPKDAASGVYSYYNLEDIMAQRGKLGNNWAGAAHWKKGTKSKSKAASSGAVASGGDAESKGKKARVLIDFSCEIDIEKVFHATAPKKKARGSKKSGAAATDPYCMTDAAISKQNKTSNLLPHDSGVGVAQLYRLFLRPNAAARVAKNRGTAGGAPLQASNAGNGESTENGKDNSDGFDDVEMDNDMVFDDGPSFSNADAADGDFMDRDNYVVEMQGVRKIEKIDVGYATTAKKVDVKRLKKDLWEELQVSRKSSPRAVVVAAPRCFPPRCTQFRFANTLQSVPRER